MKYPGRLLVAILLAHGLIAAEPETLPDTKPAGGGGSRKFVFSLLPKSLQRNPALDFNVITEMTAEGKKFPKPTAKQPLYYVAQPGKFMQMGTEPANERPPPVADLERAMQKALATNGYLAHIDSGPAPRLAVVFNYGSFARFSTDFEDFEAETIAEQAYQDAINQVPPPNPPPEPPIAPMGSPVSADQLLPYVLSDVVKRRDVLERATLIAGAKFASELGDAISREITYRIGGGGGGAPPEDDPNSPFNRFRNKNDKLLAFVEDSFSSCYFVIASAYDYAAMAKGNRILLWRTKMTVNSSGVSMTESLPTLIATAGPYLGREMSEAESISKRISREGHVQIGTATVVDDSVKPAPQPSAPAPTPPPAKP